MIGRMWSGGVLALVLVMAGCTTTATGPDGAARSVVVPSGADSIAEVLGCALVGPASVDQQGWSGPSAQAAVAALADDLGLRQGDPRQWLEDDSFDEANDRSLWLLFTTSGRGYGVAAATPTDEGQWSAQVDQWCAETAPLPLATNETPTPSTTPAFRVPPIPGPDSQTLALATFDQTAGINSTSGIFVTNPTEDFVVQAQCLAAARGVTLGYTVLVDEETVSSGRIPCDGGIYRDSAVAGTGQEAQYTVQLAVGTDVVRAYAALVPQ
jgi:hypothetical protein